MSDDVKIALGTDEEAIFAKPYVLVLAGSSEVVVQRSLSDFPASWLAEKPVAQESSILRAAIALGANIGDKSHNIEYALRLLEAAPRLGVDPEVDNPVVDVVDTSFLYESAPMEPEDRGPLDNLQGHLVVPHPRLHARDFVLPPLADMIPDYVHPSFCKSISRMVSSLASTSSEPPLKRVIPTPRLPLSSSTEANEYGITSVPETLTSWTYTPESPGHPTPSPTVQSTISLPMHSRTNSVSAGASIIDIGGYPTRPGAAYVSPEEETRRVVPVVQAMRAKEGPARDVPISVDTFRPEVAEAAIQAGASCINDVYAFMGADAYPFDDAGRKAKSDAVLASMKDIALRIRVCICGKMPTVVESVQVELGDIVERVVRGKRGARRWLVIVDPGVGFGKTVEGNLALLRDGAQVVADVQIGPDPTIEHLVKSGCH
ncbi:Dihydropteroate synthase-like protein [Schizophyllum commune]